ncbi:unnamed protein product [Meloidogyne enterolobii]|uniref:Uncharacterized protein n=2 Tax=Meloidogyne enterolobii TaxID=390850 RepID=A0ACB0Y9Z6_MELEN|nr:unnamed protein product [Meloidogyne enterolobii]
MNYINVIINLIHLLIIISNGNLSDGYCFQVTNGVPSYSEGPNCFQISNGGYRANKFSHHGGNSQFGTLPKGGEGFWQKFPFFGQQFVYSGYNDGKGWGGSTQCSASCIGTMCSHSCN